MIITVKNDFKKYLENWGLTVIAYKKYIYSVCEYTKKNPQLEADRQIMLIIFVYDQRFERLNDAIREMAESLTHIISASCNEFIGQILKQAVAESIAAEHIRTCEALIQSVANAVNDRLGDYMGIIAELCKTVVDAVQTPLKPRAYPPFVRKMAKCSWTDLCCRRRPRYTARSML